MRPACRPRAVKDGNENYILNGEKWFSCSASVADIAFVMAKTDPNAPRHKQYSTFLVELPNPGYNIKRNIKNMAIEGAHYDQLSGGHSEIDIKDLKVPAQNLLGGEGNGFNMGQHRLAYGRLRHGMHNIAKAQRALDMATKRVLSARPSACCSPTVRPCSSCSLNVRASSTWPLDAPAHRLQGRKGDGSDLRIPLLKSFSPTWCTRWSTPRSSCTVRLATARIPIAGTLVHSDALAAVGRRSGRSPQMDDRPQRHQGVPEARHHGAPPLAAICCN